MFRSTPTEDFIKGTRYRQAVAGIIGLLALLMLVSFATTSWMTVETSALHSDDEAQQELLSTIAVLVQDPDQKDDINLTGLAILTGSNEAVPTLDLDQAAASKDQGRFVDLFLITIPLGALLLMALAGAYGVGRLKSPGVFITILGVALAVYLLADVWKTLSAVDFRGYDQVTSIRRVQDRYPTVDVLNEFYSTNEHQLLSLLIAAVTVVAWFIYKLAEAGVFRVGYREDLREKTVDFFSKKRLGWYLTSIVLLVGAIVIIDWAYPLVEKSPVKFYQLTYNGIAEGMLLSLVALGLVMIYKASDVINFAHGEMMTIGTYIFAELLVRYEYTLSVSLLIAALLMVLLGALIERFILRPLIGEPIISVIMVTIGLSSVIKAIVGAYWENQPQNWQVTGSKLQQGFLPLLTNNLPKESGLYKEMATGNYQVFADVRLPYSFKYENVYIILIGLVMIAFLTVLFKYSKQGIAMRATADDQQAALSMGISVKRIFAIAWGVAALFAGIAGILIGDIGSGATIDIPTKGLRAFPVIILGGLDSIMGAIVGGLMIGLLEQYSVAYIDPWIKENISSITLAVGTKDIIPYLVLIGILMFRPYGLFGKRIIERV